MIGPGLTVEFNTSVGGPYAVDDAWQGTISDHATSELLCQFYVLNKFSSPSVNCQMGRIDPSHFTITQPIVRFFVAPGSSCDINVRYAHASGATVDGPTTFTGYAWDATSGLYLLLIDPGSSGLDAQILAAVHKTFPST